MGDTQNFIASDEQRQYDCAMAEYDCWATQAHVAMLAKAGVIETESAATILHALSEIEVQCQAGEFPYDPSLGAQLTLEKLIVERVGSKLGYQVHTGRSRNDQVLVTQKLYVRDRILECVSGQLDMINALLDTARTTVDVIMPGYTHMQPARPTTFAQWCAAYADMFLRDVARLRDAYVRNNTSPLGAAESYGTSWSLDREYTAQLLAFDGVDEIPIDAISSRGEGDTDFLCGLSFVALHLSKMAQDLLQMNTFEYGMVELGAPDAQRMGKLTGSSIMPQKKNPDVLELLRAQAAEIHAYLFHCLELLKGLPMGYNRDSRDTKGPIIRGTQSVTTSAQRMAEVIKNVALNRDRMLQLVKDNYSMATDLAEFLAQRHHVPYRVMYRIVGEVVDEAIGNGKKLYELEPQAFADSAQRNECVLEISHAELAEALAPVKAIHRRTNLGGAAAGRMKEWTESRAHTLAEYQAWVKSTQARIATAREQRHQQTQAAKAASLSKTGKT